MLIWKITSTDEDGTLPGENSLPLEFSCGKSKKHVYYKPEKKKGSKIKYEGPTDEMLDANFDPDAELVTKIEEAFEEDPEDSSLG